MSQHRFSTTHEGQPVSVLMRWDKPIGHFFMVIEWDGPRSEDFPSACAGDDGSDDDTILYSNLDEPNSFELSIRYFRAKLIEFGIRVPESMFEQVEIDRAKRAGNRNVRYRADGSFHEA